VSSRQSGQQTTVGAGRRLLLNSDFQIDDSFKIEDIYGSVTQN